MESFQTAHQLEFLRIAYPIVLLLVFFGASIAESVQAAKRAKANDREVQYGPNGKPLPKRLRTQTCATQSARHKHRGRENYVFACFTTCVLGTLVADGAIRIAHVIFAKSEQWWCGQAVVVSYVVYRRNQGTNLSD